MTKINVGHSETVIHVHVCEIELYPRIKYQTYSVSGAVAVAVVMSEMGKH